MYLRTEAEYEAALKEIEQYFDNEPKLGTPEADRFNELTFLIAEYEDRHWSI